MKTRGLLLAVVVVAWGAAVVIAGPLQGTREIVWAYNRDMKNLDPAFLPGSPNYQIVMNVFNGLVRYAPDAIVVEPSLATSWEISEDGKTYVFHLRDDVYFHKGYGKMTSEDVKFSFDRIMDPDVGSKYFGALQNVEEVAAVDDYTVRIEMKQPEAAFLIAVLGFRPGYVVSKAAVLEKGDGFATDPIGTGPYVFDHWTPGTEVGLVANEEYWGGAPYFKKVTMKIIPEETVTVMALLQDEVNYFMIRDTTSHLSLMGQPGVAINAPAGTQIWPVWLNTSHPPLDDVRVRRAIAHAIDKELMNETVNEGTGVPTNSVLAPPMFGYTEDVATYDYNPDLSRDLLEKAGYDPDTEFELVYRPTGIKDKIATVLQGFLADVGINLKLIQVEEGAYEEIRSRGDVDLNIESFSRFDPNQVLTEFLLTDAFPPGHNISYYAQVDDLIISQSGETDDVRRAATLAEIQRKVAEDVPGVMMFIRPLVSAYRDYIKGVPDNTGHWMARFDLMYMEE